MKIIRVNSFSQVLGFSNIGWIVVDAYGDPIITSCCKLVHVPMNRVYFLKSNGRVESRYGDQMEVRSIGELSRIEKLSDIKERADHYKQVSTIPDVFVCQGAN